MNRRYFHKCTAIFLVLAAFLMRGAWAGIVPGSQNLGAIWMVGDSITQGNADGDAASSPRKSLHDLLTAGGFTFSYTGSSAENLDGLPEDDIFRFHSGYSGAMITNPGNIASRVDMTRGLDGVGRDTDTWGSTQWTSGRLALVKPDVILILLGTNDVHQLANVADSSPDAIAAALKTYVNKVYSLPGLGSPSVFISTIPPNRRMDFGRDQSADVSAFNALLPGVVSSLKSSGKDVHLVDCYTPLNEAYATAMGSDGLHPNAAGNAIIAGQWFTAIQARVTAPAATVFDRVPEATAEGYQVLFELPLTDDGAYRDAALPPYTVDNSATAPAFDRVAYYLELQDAGGIHWAYASMDAFTSVAKELGLPHHAANPVRHQRTVQNLNILSNKAGIIPGTSMDGGQLEMWPSSYAVANSGLTYAADGATYDWGDSGASTAAGHGSFQVHNPVARQSVFCFNGWGVSGTDDLGIGNRPTGDKDWTFAANAAGYSAKKLVILVRPRAHNLVFTQIPKQRALVPRNLATNLGTVTITGTESFGGYDKVLLRRFRNGIFQSEAERSLVYGAPGGAPFSFTSEIPAELASYDFEVLLAKGSQRMLSRRIQDVVAGDAYLFYGQSNTEAGRNFSSNNTSSGSYASPWLRTYGQNSDSGVMAANVQWWDTADGDGAGSTFNHPGAVGQWAIVLGRKIMDTHGIPVALLNGARGGYAITLLQRDDASPDSLNDNGAIRRTYNRLRHRAIKSGLAGSIRAMFYYQGESDSQNATQHADGFAALRADWKTDYPGLQRIYVGQVRPGCGVTASNLALRQVQRKFADQYPDVSVMATNGLGAHDGCHYKFITGYESLGQHFFRLVSRDLYGGPGGPNVDALNPASIEFTDDTRTRIKVTMRDANATILIQPQALADFALPGLPATITGASAVGNALFLDLSQAASSNAILVYRSHTGTGGWITNGNGVGLLSFSEPVASPGPMITLAAPATSREATVGEIISVSATASPGAAGGAIIRMELLVNGVPQISSSGNTLNTTWTVPVAAAHWLEIAAYDAGGHSNRVGVSILAPANTSPGGVASGLRIWFKAEAGVVKGTGHEVQTWQDQSGNGFHAAQSSVAAQPEFVEGLYGSGPGLRFDGGDMLNSSVGMPTGSYTKIIRFKIAASGSSNLMSALTGGNAAARDHAFHVPSLKPAIYHTGAVVTSSQAVALHTSAVAMATYDTAINQAKVYLDGVLRGTGTAAGDNTLATFQLGAFNNNSTLTGSLAEVIVYDRVLTDEERSAVFDYLDNKYRSPAQLWQKANFPGQTFSATADPDGDGLVNCVEYALGLNPNLSDDALSHLPQVKVVGDQIQVTYRRAAQHPDVITQLERSPDLVTWTTVNESSLGAADGVETRKHTAPISEGGNGNFYRLRVTLP